MPPVRKKQSEIKKEGVENGIFSSLESVTKPASASEKYVPEKYIHITPENITSSLNSAVANINAVFQLRDHLQTEINALKEELSIGRDIKIEVGKLDVLKREQDEFVYEYQIKKTRLEREMKDVEDACKVRLKKEEDEHDARLEEQTEEHNTKLKTQAEVQGLKLKLEKEDHERRIKMEREDWERERGQLAAEKAAFDARQKAFEAKAASLREELMKELNRDNAHAVEVLKLNHQKELELLRSELKLEQAHRAKFEVMLKEAREQNEKLGEQLTALSREALSSASTSSMAAKLKDIVTQMSGGPAVRAS